MASDGTGIIYNDIIANDFDWVGIVEHQLKNTGGLPRIPGYFVIAKAAHGGVGGVCFYIKNKLKYKVQKLKRKTSHNILWIKLPGSRGRDLYMSLIYCRTDSHFEQVNSFYAALAHDILMYGAMGEILVIGDFNSRLGKLTGDKNPAGAYTTNKNAPMFQSFVDATNLILLNSKLAHGVPTFVMPFQRASSIIDLVLASSPIAAGIRDFSVDLKDTGSYVAHNTVIKFSHPISTITTTYDPQSRQPKLILTEQNQKAFFDAVVANLDVKFENPESGFRNLLHSFEEAQHTLQKRPVCTRRQVHEQIPRIVELRRQLNRWASKLMHLRAFPADSDQVKFVSACYARIARELHRVETAVRADKWEQQLARMDKLDFVNRTKLFWKLVAGIRKSNTAETALSINNFDGLASTSKEEFCANWVDFYSRLYEPARVASKLRKRLEIINLARARNSEVSGPLDEPLSRAEFDDAVKCQRKNSAPGFDGVVPRMLTDGPESLKSHIFSLLSAAFAMESDLSALKQVLIFPIVKDKNEDIHCPNNYRPIALLSNIFKLYECILNRRLTEHLEGFNDADSDPEPLLREEQNGFRPGRSCVDNIFLLRELALDHKFQQRGKPLFFAFLDIRKAFDRVCRPILWDRLFKMGVHGRMWRVLRGLFSNFRGQVKFKNNLLTSPFRIDTGVVQGSRLGPTLFNVFFDDLIRSIRDNFAGASFSFGKNLPVLAYADDLVLISNDEGELNAMLNFCHKYSVDNEFEFNIKKSKILKVHSRNRTTAAQHTMGGQALEEVEHYKYLGIPLGRAFHSNSRPAAFARYFELIERKAQARSMVVRFLGAKRDGLRPKTGLLLYKLLVRPIMEYATPVICFNKKQMEKLETLQNGAIKAACGLRYNTKTESVRIVTGIESLQLRMAFLKLKHLYRIQTKPSNSLVHVILKEIQNQHRSEKRPGFLSECEKLCGKYGIPLEEISPDTSEMESLKEFGGGLKAQLYHAAFQKDLKVIRDSNQASVLASLFPPDASYFTYRPIDMIERVLHRHDRSIRTGFLQNLCGSSFLANCVQKRCCFCKESTKNIAHYIFECKSIAAERKQFLAKISEHLKKTNKHVHGLWQESAQNTGDPVNRANLQTIIFGGNFATRNGSDWLIFRKSKYRRSHHSDKTCLLTGQFLANLNNKADNGS